MHHLGHRPRRLRTVGSDPPLSTTGDAAQGRRDVPGIGDCRFLRSTLEQFRRGGVGIASREFPSPPFDPGRLVSPLSSPAAGFFGTSGLQG